MTRIITHANVEKGSGKPHYLASHGQLMRCLEDTFKTKDLRCVPIFQEGGDLNKAQCGIIVAAGS